MTDPFERLRRPAYTGPNRCWPCTIVNGLLLSFLAGVVALRGRRVAAFVIAVVGTGAIALRGYVVPYTPQFAPRLVEALPLPGTAFDHGPAGAEPDSLSDTAGTQDRATEAAEPSGEAVLVELLDAGALVADDEELRLTAAFRDDWHRELRQLRESDTATLARIADERTPPSIDVRTERTWGRPVLVLESDNGSLLTLQRGVAVAELAADCALESRVDDAAIRQAAGRPLRSLLEECPLCGGAVTITQSTCCGETTPIGETPAEKLICPDCDERFFVFDD